MTSEPRVEIQLQQWKLLQLLADGNEHSGQALANILGVSRTAVWKQLSKLSSLGVELVSRPGHGYCISGGLDFLSEQQILDSLSTDCLNLIHSLTILPIVDSTNTFLLNQQSAEKMLICMAECQTAGKGRRGRTWVSPFAKNIYLSLKTTVDNGIAAFEGLSLAVGVAIVSALNSVGVSDLQLKWPNDILWRGRKLGGVLIEVVGDPAGRCHLVVGVGLNMQGNKEMQASIDQPWVSLLEISRSLSVPIQGRNSIASALINEIALLMANYAKNSFTYYRSQWESLNAHHGQQVDIHVQSAVVSGIVTGVTEAGALILQMEDGSFKTFHGGEVSVRGGDK